MNLGAFAKAAPVVSGVLMVVVAIMANAYWVEGVRWADKADAAKLRKDADDEARCVARMRRAKIIFQLVCVLLLATLVATVVPAFFPSTVWLAAILDAISAVSIAAFSLMYVSGRFYIPLR